MSVDVGIRSPGAMQDVYLVWIMSILLKITNPRY